MKAVEFPLNDRVLAIHRTVLNELLDSNTLNAVQNTAKMTTKDDKPVQLAELFRMLSEASFADLPNDGNAATVKSSVIRRNLQREYVGRLMSIVLGKTSVPADAKSLARLHLKEIDVKMADALKAEKDDTAKAHLDELKEQIAKTLAATVTTGG